MCSHAVQLFGYYSSPYHCLIWLSIFGLSPMSIRLIVGRCVSSCTSICKVQTIKRYLYLLQCSRGIIVGIIPPMSLTLLDYLFVDGVCIKSFWIHNLLLLVERYQFVYWMHYSPRHFTISVQCICWKCSVTVSNVSVLDVGVSIRETVSMARRFHIYSLNWRYLQFKCTYPQFNCRYLQIGLIVDIFKWIADISKWIVDIFKWIVDICNSIEDIYKSIEDIYKYSLFGDISNLIEDIFNSFGDIYNSFEDISK